jgi:hypothetical protein
MASPATIRLFQVRASSGDALAWMMAPISELSSCM